VSTPAGPHEDPARRREQERALAWAEENVGVDRAGFVTVRPPTRSFALVGLALGVLAVLAAAVSGSPTPIAVAYLVATAVGAAALVVGGVLFGVGWATGPKGVFADHNRARRLGTRLLLVAVGCLVLLAVALLGDQLLASLA
jgi:hypothetical protein